MQSPLKSEQVVAAPTTNNKPGKTPTVVARSGLWIGAAVACFALVGLAGPVFATSGPSDVPDRAAMNATSWRDIFREFLKEVHRRNGGDLADWPDSTIDDAPMAFVQAVYVQMGGDPSTLDLRKTPPLLVESALASIYVAVGGTHTTTTLIDDQFDTRTKLLWEYFVLLGGSPAPR